MSVPPTKEIGSTWEIASKGFCVNRNHGIRWPYAKAVWRIKGKLYCDDCAHRLEERL